MIVYKYNPETLEYIARHKCQVDPLDGGFAVPPHTTEKQPPSVEVNQAVFFIEGEWVVKDDNRGKLIFRTSDCSSTICQDIEIPDGYTLSIPGECQSWNGTEWVDDAEKQSEKESNEAKSNLNSIDSKTIRALRSVVIAIAKGSVVPEKDMAILEQNESSAETERQKVK